MSALDQLAASVGSWRGTNRLHNPHTQAPEDSPSTLAVTPVLDGRFLRLDYTWACEGSPQTGSLLMGADPESGVTGHWIDTWHMGHKGMSIQGAAEAEQIRLRGSYACAPGPDWGWRIEITTHPQRLLRLLMFNVSPEGQSQPAVEATYTRESMITAESSGAGAELRLATIGQIAVTVSDVPSALQFYRDVLGLQFLFSPSPNLAFLAAGGVRIMLSPPEGAGRIGGNSILYFKVSQIEAVFEALVLRGAPSERPPQLTAKMPDHELWIGFLRDPDGNLVGVMEEKPSET